MPNHNKPKRIQPHSLEFPSQERKSGYSFGDPFANPTDGSGNPMNRDNVNPFDGPGSTSQTRGNIVGSNIPESFGGGQQPGKATLWDPGAPQTGGGGGKSFSPMPQQGGGGQQGQQGPQPKQPTYDPFSRIPMSPDERQQASEALREIQNSVSGLHTYKGNNMKFDANGNRVLATGGDLDSVQRARDLQNLINQYDRRQASTLFSNPNSEAGLSFQNRLDLQQDQQAFAGGQSDANRDQQRYLQTDQQAFQTLHQGWDQEFQGGQNELDRGFQGGQADLNRAQQTALQGSSQAFQAGQQDSSQAFQSRENSLDRQLQVELQESMAELQHGLQDKGFEFQEEQNSLDRAIEKDRLQLQKTVQLGQLDLARRQQGHIEEAQKQQHELQQKQFKLSLFQNLAQSPEILYFLGQSQEALGQFEDLFDGGGGGIGALISKIQQAPPVNIQQYRALGSQEQSAADFANTANTGDLNPQQTRFGQAPGAAQNTQPQFVSRG